MKSANFSRIKAVLDEYHDLFNCPSFIDDDPIQVPHSFTRREDIEIAAFLASSLAWGKRKGIINSSRRMMALMDNAPFDFICSAKEKDFSRFSSFVHRTFNGTDCVFFVRALRDIYQRSGGLKTVFESSFQKTGDVRQTLALFRDEFFRTDHFPRSEKHLSDTRKGSAAKRLNVFLMWMVRRDKGGVHFGLWRKIPMSALFIPLDVHCGNVARSLGLLSRKQNDWKAVEELTAALREFSPEDPVRYDFALFGMGVNRVKIPQCGGKGFPLR
jgi:uncharacterized protein (TIGR02757 family)